MANVFYGSGILFGTNSTSGTLTGLGTLVLLQGLETTDSSDEELVQDQSGNVAQVTKYNHKRKATLDFVPTSSSNTGTISVTAVTAGVTVALTDSSFTPISDTFIVDELALTRSNTKALMAKISLSTYLQNNVP